MNANFYPQIVSHSFPMQFPILSIECGIKFLQLTARINTRKGLLQAPREMSDTPRISLIEADNEKRAALESIKDMKINEIYFFKNKKKKEKNSSATSQQMKLL